MATVASSDHDKSGSSKQRKRKQASQAVAPPRRSLRSCSSARGVKMPDHVEVEDEEISILSAAPLAPAPAPSSEGVSASNALVASTSVLSTPQNRKLPASVELAGGHADVCKTVTASVMKEMGLGFFVQEEKEDRAETTASPENETERDRWVRKMRETIASVKEERLMHKLTIQQLYSQASGCTAQLTESNAELQAAKKDLKKFQKVKEDLKNTADELEKARNELNELQKVKKDFKDTADELQKSKSDAEKLQRAIINYVDELDEAKNELQKLRKDLKDTAEELQNAKKELKDFDKVKKDLKQAEDAKSELQKSINKHAEELQNARDDLKVAQQNVLAAEQKEQAAKSKMAQFKQRAEEAEEAAKEVKKSVQALQDKVAEKTGIINLLAKNIKNPAGGFLEKLASLTST